MNEKVDSTGLRVIVCGRTRDGVGLRVQVPMFTIKPVCVRRPIPRVPFLCVRAKEEGQIVSVPKDYPFV